MNITELATLPAEPKLAEPRVTYNEQAKEFTIVLPERETWKDSASGKTWQIATSDGMARVKLDNGVEVLVTANVYVKKPA